MEEKDFILIREEDHSYVFLNKIDGSKITVDDWAIAEITNKMIRVSPENALRKYLKEVNK